jgi:hypothetical protein
MSPANRYRAFPGQRPQIFRPTPYPGFVFNFKILPAKEIAATSNV